MATSADLQATLDKLGLGFLYSYLEGTIVPDQNIDATDADTIGRLIKNNPATMEAYNTRFSGNAVRERNGLKALTPLEYIRAEKEYIDTLRATGLPLGFYDQQADLAKFIGEDVSRIELEGRIVQGYRASQQANAATKQQLKELYNITDSDLAAYFLDPTKATDVIGRKKDAQLFSRQMTAAQIAAQASTQAGMRLNLGQAEELVNQGVTQQAAQQGFSALAEQQGLFQPLMAGEEAIGQEEQIAAAFGTSAAAAQRVATRRRRRQAEFETGGSIAAGQTGVSGLRSAAQ